VSFTDGGADRGVGFAHAIEKCPPAFDRIRPLIRRGAEGQMSAADIYALAQQSRAGAGPMIPTRRPSSAPSAGGPAAKLRRDITRAGSTYIFFCFMLADLPSTLAGVFLRSGWTSFIGNALFSRQPLAWVSPALVQATGDGPAPFVAANPLVFTGGQRACILAASDHLRGVRWGEVNQACCRTPEKRCWNIPSPCLDDRLHGCFRHPGNDGLEFSSGAFRAAHTIPTIPPPMTAPPPA